MMKNGVLLLLLMVGFFTVAQENWSFTFRPSLHFPTREVFNEPLRLGNGFDITADYTLNKHSHVYAGWTYNVFDTDEDFEEENINLKHSGLMAGALYYFNVYKNQKSPFYIRAGITYTSIDADSENRDFIIETDWSIGTQLGIGWKLQPTQNWFFLPELRYSSFSNAYEFDNTKSYVNLTHVTFSLGLMHSF